MFAPLGACGLLRIVFAGPVEVRRWATIKLTLVQQVRQVQQVYCISMNCTET